MLPAMPASRNKVIYGYWLLSSDFCKTPWIFLHDPVCPKTGPVLSKNLVRSVLKPGPFCPGTWSVLSLDVVRFVLKHGPFVWSVLPMVRFVRVPLHVRWMHLLNTRICRYTCIYITPTVQTLHYCPAGA